MTARAPPGARVRAQGDAGAEARARRVVGLPGEGRFAITQRVTRPWSWRSVRGVSERGERGEPAAVDGARRDLAGAIHDVSNALTVLLGWVGEARAHDATPESIAYALTIIEQRARVARDLARRAIGSTPIDEQRPIGELAQEVLDSLFVEASRAGATLVATGLGTGAKVAGALDLSQVLTNVVLNALAHAPRGSSVAVALSTDDEQCSVTISDDGPGVPASRRDEIFEGASFRPGGTGVGLRHSRALARAWGGDVELVSSAPAGARFVVRWPRVDFIPRSPASTARFRELAGVRVLVVEDDTAVTQLLEAALEGRGASVTTASSPAELESAMAAGPYDAALLDLSPIGPDVRSAIARLRAGSPAIDLVLITGSVDRLPDEVASEDLKLVRKPFELPEIMAALAKKP